jgi:hypothetical protein
VMDTLTILAFCPRRRNSQAASDPTAVAVRGVPSFWARSRRKDVLPGHADAHCPGGVRSVAEVRSFSVGIVDRRPRQCIVLELQNWRSACLDARVTVALHAPHVGRWAEALESCPFGRLEPVVGPG